MIGLMLAHRPTLDQLVDTLIQEALDAIDYVGMANYDERQATARRRVRLAAIKVIRAMNSTAPMTPTKP